MLFEHGVLASQSANLLVESALGFTPLFERTLKAVELLLQHFYLGCRLLVVLLYLVELLEISVGFDQFRVVAVLENITRNGLVEPLACFLVQTPFLRVASVEGIYADCLRLDGVLAPEHVMVFVPAHSHLLQHLSPIGLQLVSLDAVSLLVLLFYAVEVAKNGITGSLDHLTGLVFSRFGHIEV